MTHPVYEINIHEDRIKGSFSDVKTLKSKIKEQRDMLKNAYENDAEYNSLQNEKEDHKRKIEAVKKRIDKEPSIVVVKNKIEELKEELKDVQMSLFAYLDTYTKQTQKTYIDIEDETYQIIPNFKLNKKIV